MAQTARTFAALETILADNSEKAISPVDLRDLLESALGCYGSIYTDGGTTSEGLTATPAKVTTWLSVGNAKNTTPSAVAGEIDVTAEGLYLVQFSASALVETAADRFKLELRKDAILVAGCSCEVSGDVGDRVCIAMGQVVAITASETLSVYASAIGAVGDLTLEHAQLTATRVG